MKLVAVLAVTLLILATSACGGDDSPKPSNGSETPEPSSGPKEAIAEQLEIDPANFDNPTTIDNEWWPLEPGEQLVYEGFSLQEGEPIAHRVVDTVLDVTKVINGITVLVSWEQDFLDDQLVEAELAFHAQDNDGNIWHLGQIRENWEEGMFVGGSAWMVGHFEGAKAGIRMLAEPKLGTPGYSQGFAPDPFFWTDSSRVYKTGEKVTVPAGTYEDVLVIEEWDQETEAGVFQLKYYKRGLGVVRIGFRGPDPDEEELELVEMSRLSAEELADARTEALKIEERAYIYGDTSPAKLIGAGQ